MAARDDYPALLDAWARILVDLNEAHDLKLRICPIYVELADGGKVETCYRAWETLELQVSVLRVDEVASFLRGEAQVEVVGAPHSLLRAETFRRWFERPPSRSEEVALQHVRPLLRAGNVGQSLLPGRVHALAGPGSGGALGVLAGLLAADEVLGQLSMRAEDVDDGDLVSPIDRVRRRAWLEFAETEEGALRTTGDSPSRCLALRLRLTIRNLLAEGLSDLGAVEAHRHEAVDEELWWASPPSPGCLPTGDGFGRLPADTRSRLRRLMLASTNEVEREAARRDFEELTASWPTWWRESLMGGILEAVRPRPGDAHAFDRLDVVDESLALFGHTFKARRGLLRLAVAYAEHGENAFWPIDPAADFLIVRQSPGALLVQLGDCADHRSPDEYLQATRTLLDLVMELARLGSWDRARLPNGSSSRVPHAPTWRDAQDLPAPLARAYQRLCLATSSEQTTHRAIDDVLRVAVKLLAALTVAQLRAQDRTNIVINGKSGLSEILARPSDGDWVELALHEVSLGDAPLPMAARWIADDRDLKRVMRRLVVLRNKKSHRANPIMLDEMAHEANALACELVALISRGLRNHLLVRGGDLGSDDEGILKQRLVVLCGRSDPPDEVAVPTQAPVVHPGHVALIDLASGVALPLFPILHGRPRGGHAVASLTRYAGGLVHLADLDSTGAGEEFSVRCEGLASRIRPQPLSEDQLELAFPPGYRRIPAGEVLGERYEVCERLGSGGFADVFRARDRLSRSNVAVKVLFDCLAQDVVTLRRFRQEAEIQARIQDPHVLRVAEQAFDRDRSLEFLVTEFADGGTLLSRLAEMANEPTRQREVLFALARALRTIHSHDVIHRDVRPDNIFLVGEVWKLGDFGIAHLLPEGRSRLTRLAPHVDESYRAPEALLPQPPTAALDVYMFGRVGLAVALGREPTQDTTEAGALRELPWRGVLLRCLAAKPDDRWKDGEALLAALETSGMRT